MDSRNAVDRTRDPVVRVVSVDEREGQAARAMVVPVDREETHHSVVLLAAQDQAQGSPRRNRHRLQGDVRRRVSRIALHLRHHIVKTSTHGLHLL